MPTNNWTISLQDASVCLGGARVLHQVNWEIRPQENWVVVGHNGSGKSTLLKLVRGDLWPEPRQGRRCYQAPGLSQESPIGYREQTALISPEAQERYLKIEWSLPAIYVVQTGFAQTDYLQENLRPEQRQRAEALMAELGVEHLRRRSILSLSTGELRRVMIARALAGNPKTLFLDEFTDGLDPASRADVLEMVSRVAARGTQLIYTTHRREEILPCVTHLLELEGGRVKGQKEFKGVPHGGLEQKIHPSVSVVENVPASREGRSVLLKLEKTNIYRGGVRAIKDLDWTIHAGEHWAVVGPNGSGKTSLLKVVAGEHPPSLRSRVSRFGGQSFETIWDLKQLIGYFSCDFQTQYDGGITGAEVVASGYFATVGVHEKLSTVQKARVRTLFREFDLESLRARPLETCSFGQVRKLLLLRAIVKNPRLLVLDEPFDGLDAQSRNEMAQCLEQMAASGMTLVVVTHHLSDLPACVKHVLALKKGRKELVGMRVTDFRNPRESI